MVSVAMPSMVVFQIYQVVFHIQNRSFKIIDSLKEDPTSHVVVSRQSETNC